MAKRVPPDEKPYRPVDDALVRSVMNPEPLPEPGEGSELSDGGDQPRPVERQQPPKLLKISGGKGEKGKLRAETVNEPEKLSREKRVLLSPTEDRELERIVSDMAEQLGTPLKSSHVLRATVILLRHAREELVKQSQKIGPVKRPANGDAAALAAFEHYMAQVIDTAIRNTKRLE